MSRTLAKRLISNFPILVTTMFVSCDTSYESKLRQLQEDCTGTGLAVVYDKKLESLFVRYGDEKPLHAKLGFLGIHYDDCKILATDVANIRRWLAISSNRSKVTDASNHVNFDEFVPKNTLPPE